MYNRISGRYKTICAAIKRRFYGTIFLFYWFIFILLCDSNGVAVLWRMHHILQVMLRLPDERIIFCVLLFNECVLCVTMTQLLINHELRYMAVFTSTAIWQTDDQWNVLHHLTQVTPSCSCNSNTTPTSITSFLTLSHPALNIWVCGCLKNPYLFHYFLWADHIWFLPTFPRKQLGHKTRAICIWFSYLWSWCLLGSTAAHQTNWITYHICLNII